MDEAGALSPTDARPGPHGARAGAMDKAGSALSAVVAAISGIAPHVLHHVMCCITSGLWPERRCLRAREAPSWSESPASPCRSQCCFACGGASQPGWPRRWPAPYSWPCICSVRSWWGRRSPELYRRTMRPRRRPHLPNTTSTTDAHPSPASSVTQRWPKIVASSENSAKPPMRNSVGMRASVPQSASACAWGTISSMTAVSRIPAVKASTA